MVFVLEHLQYSFISSCVLSLRQINYFLQKVFRYISIMHVSINEGCAKVNQKNATEFAKVVKSAIDYCKAFIYGSLLEGGIHQLIVC